MTYRYFGRAKDLPGVRELFQSKKNEEEEESQAFAYYKKFMGQGPAYYGDLDETQGPDGILAYERTAEEDGTYIFLTVTLLDELTRIQNGGLHTYAYGRPLECR